MLKFYANINGSNEGPFSIEELKDLVKQKKITKKTYILLDPDLCEPVSNLQLPVLLHQVEAVPGQRVEVAVRHPVQALHGHK